MLSDLQKRVLQFIAKYHTEHGFAPNTREICKAHGIDNGSVQRVLLTLQAKGFIDRIPFRTRETTVLKSAEEHPLTSRQKELLKFLEAYSAEHGKMPIMKERGAHMGLSSITSVNRLIGELVKKGAITRALMKARGITIVRPAGRA